jgi:predicted ATP-dependent serine protease
MTLFSSTNGTIRPHPVTAKGGMSRVAAMLEKHLGVQLSDQDFYVNVARGWGLRTR